MVEREPAFSQRDRIRRDLADMALRPGRIITEFKPISTEQVDASLTTIFHETPSLSAVPEINGLRNPDYDPLKYPMHIEARPLTEGLDGKSSEMSGRLDGMGHE